MHVSFTEAGRPALDHALARAEPHWRPMLKAVRDGGCAFTVVMQGAAFVEIATGRPHILLVGDDCAAALGPGAFDRDFLRRYLPRCGAGLVISCAPVVSLYWHACARAVQGRQDVVIVETRPEREAEWVDLIRATASASIALGIGTVAPAGRT